MGILEAFLYFVINWVPPHRLFSALHLRQAVSLGLLVVKVISLLRFGELARYTLKFEVTTIIQYLMSKM